MLIFNVLLGPGEQLGDSGRGRGVPSTLGHIRGPSQGQKIRVWTVRFTKDTKILAWTVKRQDSCGDSKTPRFLCGQQDLHKNASFRWIARKNDVRAARFKYGRYRGRLMGGRLPPGK